MTRLTRKVSGHELVTDDASVEFWKSAGYSVVDEPAAKKVPAKKAAPSKKSK